MTKELVEKEERTRLLRPQPDEPQHAKKRGFNTNELLSEFQAFSRQPFVEILSELISGVPTPEAIRTFAEDHPDRWVNAVKGMANLAGFHDKLEIEGSLAKDISKLGDAQLIAKLDELGQKIDGMGIRTGLSEAEYVEVEQAKKDPTPKSEA